MTEREIQSKEDQLIAAISHAAALIPTFGLLIPLVVWLTQKERSMYLKQQSLQAAAWQSIAFVMQILLVGCYFISFFLFIPISIFAEGESFNVDPATVGAIAGGVMLLFICVIMIYMVGGLVHLGFAIGGSVQVLRGSDFEYPFIGRWINNRLNADAENQSNQEAADIT